MQLISSIIIFLLLIAALVQDIKHKKVKVYLITVLILVSVARRIISNDLFVSDYIYGMVIGCILILISLLSRQAFGLADSSIILAIGIAYGGWNAIEILLGSLLLCSIISIVLLALKKVTRKSELAFLPYIVISYIAVGVQGGAIF